MQIRWIFFDVGGVLLDDRPLREWKISALLSLGSRYHRELSRESVEQALLQASRRSGSMTRNALLSLVGGTHFNEAVLALKALDYDMRRASERQEIRPEALEVVSRLSDSFSLGLLANQPQTVRKKLAEAGLLKHLSSKIVSADSHYQKPDPIFFRDMIARVGTRAEQALLIDDDLDRGVLPAKRVGMKAVWYRPDWETRHVISSIDGCVTNLRQIERLPIIRNILANFPLGADRVQA